MQSSLHSSVEPVQPCCCDLPHPQHARPWPLRAPLPQPRTGRMLPWCWACWAQTWSGFKCWRGPRGARQRWCRQRFALNFASAPFAGWLPHAACSSLAANGSASPRRRAAAPTPLCSIEDHSIAWLAIMPTLREFSLEYTTGQWLTHTVAFPAGDTTASAAAARVSAAGVPVAARAPAAAPRRHGGCSRCPCTWFVHPLLAALPCPPANATDAAALQLRCGVTGLPRVRSHQAAGLEKLTLRRMGHVAGGYAVMWRLPDALPRLAALRQLRLPRLELSPEGWAARGHPLAPLGSLTTLEVACAGWAGRCRGPAGCRSALLSARRCTAARL